MDDKYKVGHYLIFQDERTIYPKISVIVKQLEEHEGLWLVCYDVDPSGIRDFYCSPTCYKHTIVPNSDMIKLLYGKI
jgi:hypothetical protein